MTEMSMLRTVPFLVAMLAAILVVSPARAQIGSAQLEVRTLAGDEVVLPEVEVVVTHVATGFVRTAFTNSRGTAVVTGLAPGSYRIEARLEGFETAVDPARVLRTGHVGRLNLVMRPRIEGELEISEDVPLVNVFRTDSSTNIVPEQMMSLPVPEDCMQPPPRVPRQLQLTTSKPAGTKSAMAASHAVPSSMFSTSTLKVAVSPCSTVGVLVVLVISRSTGSESLRSRISWKLVLAPVEPAKPMPSEAGGASGRV